MSDDPNRMSDYERGVFDGRGESASRIASLTAERDQWKAGSAHVNGKLLERIRQLEQQWNDSARYRESNALKTARILQLEAALRLVREWADGACPYFDKGREADILGAEAETHCDPRGESARTHDNSTGNWWGFNPHG